MRRKLTLSPKRSSHPHMLTLNPRFFFFFYAFLQTTMASRGRAQKARPHSSPLIQSSRVSETRSCWTIRFCPAGSRRSTVGGGVFRIREGRNDFQCYWELSNALLSMQRGRGRSGTGTQGSGRGRNPQAIENTEILGLMHDMLEVFLANLVNTLQGGGSANQRELNIPVLPVAQPVRTVEEEVNIAKANEAADQLLYNREFLHHQPSNFDGVSGSEATETWLYRVVEIFDMIGMPENLRANLAAMKLTGSAVRWIVEHQNLDETSCSL